MADGKPTDSDRMDVLQKLKDIRASMDAQDTLAPSEATRGAKLTPEAERGSDADVEKCGELVEAEILAAAARHLGKAELVEPTEDGRIFCFIPLDTPVTVNYPVPSDLDGAPDRDSDSVQVVTFQVKKPAFWLELDAADEDGIKVDTGANKIWPLLLTATKHNAERSDTNQGRGLRGEIFLDIPQDGDITYSLRRIDVPFTTAQIGLYDLLVALAAQDAKQGGDTDRANRVWASFYGLDLDTADVAAIPAPAPRQDTYKVADMVQGLSKVSTNIQEVMNGVETGFVVSAESEAKKVTTALYLNYEAEGVSIRKPITQWDMAVHDTVASLWNAGNRAMTVRQIAQTLTQTDRPSAGMVKRVEESCDKQRFTAVRIDFTDALRGRKAEFNGEPVTTGYKETYMLNARKEVIETARGREAGYVLNEPPVIYYHDKVLRQITTYPAKVLRAASEAASNTETNVMLRRYLLKRIRQAEHGSTNPHILYVTMADNAGVDISGSRTKRNRLCDTARAYLDAWTAEGFISGWHEYAKGGEALTTTRKTTIEVDDGHGGKTKKYKVTTKRKKGYERKAAEGVRITVAK